MTSSQTYPIYTVRADRQTGEWLGTPEPTGERMERRAFLDLDAGDDTHRDTYEGAGDRTRLILITWVD
jgi:hypothetical protein